MRSSVVRATGAAAMLAGLHIAGPAGAEETGLFSRVGSYPQISGTIPFQINNNYTFDQNDGTDDYNNLSTDTEPAIQVSFLPPSPETLVLFSQFVIQQVKDPTPGENQFFEDTGVFLQDLTLTYGDGRWQVFGGKFTPNFGRAWDLAPDLFGQDLPQDYEFDEQIGFGGGYTFGDGSWGFHGISASAFFVDTTVLSESLFTNRGRTRLSDGGPGNTNSPESFAVAYDGTAIPILPVPGIVDYQLGFIRQAEGDGPDDEAAQTGYVASLDLSFPLVDDTQTILDSGYMEVSPLIEFVYFDDADGISGQDRTYLTVATDLIVGDWDFGAAYTWKHTDPPVTSSSDDQIFSVQGGYTFRNSFQIEVGWNIAEEEGVMSQTVGIQLSYEYDF